MSTKGSNIVRLMHETVRYFADRSCWITTSLPAEFPRIARYAIWHTLIHVTSLCQAELDEARSSTWMLRPVLEIEDTAKALEFYEETNHNFCYGDQVYRQLCSVIILSRLFRRAHGVLSGAEPHGTYAPSAWPPCQQSRSHGLCPGMCLQEHDETTAVFSAKQFVHAGKATKTSSTEYESRQLPPVCSIADELFRLGNTMTSKAYGGREQADVYMLTDLVSREAARRVQCEILVECGACTVDVQ